MQAVKIEKVQSRSISCKGDKEIQYHPHVYLEIDPKIGYIICPYCRKKFRL